MSDFIVQNIDNHFVLLWKYVLLENIKEKHSHIYMIHLFFLHAKFHIHKCKLEGNGALYWYYMIFYETKSS